MAAALVGSYGTCDDALVDALTGRIAPRGRLPFDLPRSMEDVRRHAEDVPGFDDPLLRSGRGSLFPRHDAALFSGYPLTYPLPQDPPDPPGPG